MALCYIGIGSNLGERVAHLLRAVEELRSVGKVRQISGIYETEPEGVLHAQPDFLNAVIELETTRQPNQLLKGLLKIEAEMGRVRTKRGMPREIDLDLLAVEDRVSTDSNLMLPHPRMHLRKFVLEPMAELAPEWIHPVEKKTVLELLASL